MIVDYHVHLRDDEERVTHTVEAVLPFVATAVARGVHEIGFTEHVYYFRQTAELWDVPYLSERCVYDLDAYCDAVLEAKTQGLPVKLGIEVDYVGDRQERLAELLLPYPWDFRLGSVHWLDGMAVDSSPGLWDVLLVDEVWQRYTDALCELAAGGTVDVLAHPDLAKIFGRRPPAELLAELHAQAALAIGASGVAVEISTGGLRKPVGGRGANGDAVSRDAERPGEPLSHLVSSIRDPRLLADQHAVDIDELVPGLAYPRVGVCEQLERVGAPVALVFRGKERADVAQTGGAKKCVGQCVGDDVTVGVADESAGVVDRHAAENERDAVAEGVRVDADADAVVAHPSGS